MNSDKIRDCNRSHVGGLLKGRDKGKQAASGWRKGNGEEKRGFSIRAVAHGQEEMYGGHGTKATMSPLES